MISSFMIFALQIPMACFDMLDALGRSCVAIPHSLNISREKIFAFWVNSENFILDLHTIYGIVCQSAIFAPLNLENIAT